MANSSAAALRWADERKEIFDTFERGHAANVAKVTQLRADAHAKYLDWLEQRDEFMARSPMWNQANGHAGYWAGFEDGLARALNVLNGKG